MHTFVPAQMKTLEKCTLILKVFSDREVDLEKAICNGQIRWYAYAGGRTLAAPQIWSPARSWVHFAVTHMARCGGCAIGHLAHPLKLIDILSKM